MKMSRTEYERHFSLGWIAEKKGVPRSENEHEAMIEGREGFRYALRTGRDVFWKRCPFEVKNNHKKGEQK